MVKRLRIPGIGSRYIVSAVAAIPQFYDQQAFLHLHTFRAGRHVPHIVALVGILEGGFIPHRVVNHLLRLICLMLARHHPGRLIQTLIRPLHGRVADLRPVVIRLQRFHRRHRVVQKRLLRAVYLTLVLAAQRVIRVLRGPDLRRHLVGVLFRQFPDRVDHLFHRLHFGGDQILIDLGTQPFHLLRGSYILLVVAQRRQCSLGRLDIRIRGLRGLRIHDRGCLRQGSDLRLYCLYLRHVLVQGLDARIVAHHSLQRCVVQRVIRRLRFRYLSLQIFQRAYVFNVPRRGYLPFDFLHLLRILGRHKAVLTVGRLQDTVGKGLRYRTVCGGYRLSGRQAGDGKPRVRVRAQGFERTGHFTDDDIGAFEIVMLLVDRTGAGHVGDSLRAYKTLVLDARRALQEFAAHGNAYDFFLPLVRLVVPGVSIAERIVCHIAVIMSSLAGVIILFLIIQLRIVSNVVARRTFFQLDAGFIRIDLLPGHLINPTVILKRVGQRNGPGETGAHNVLKAEGHALEGRGQVGPGLAAPSTYIGGTDVVVVVRVVADIHVQTVFPVTDAVGSVRTAQQISVCHILIPDFIRKGVERIGLLLVGHVVKPRLLAERQSLSLVIRPRAFRMGGESVVQSL